MNPIDRKDQPRARRSRRAAWGPAVLMLILMAGCSGKDKDLAEAEWNRKNDREYVTTWRVEGVSLLEVSLAYHGKKPDLPFDGPEPGFDWKTRDTDFYSCALRNLTDQPIHLRGVSLELDKGTPRKDNGNGDSYLIERWGNNVIPPGGSVTRRNTWVWGKGRKNTLTKTYRAELVPGGESPPADPALTALLKKHGEDSLSFSFQTPLLYRR